MELEQARLITIPFGRYREKARWALDATGLRLTLAALAAPLLGPPEHPITGRLKGTAVPLLAALRAELAATTTGRHILRLYRDHRAAGIACPTSAAAPAG